MTEARNKLAFPLLWINLAVALVLLIQVAGNGITGFPQFLHVAAYSLVFANLTGLLGLLVIGGLAAKLMPGRFPPVPVVAVGIIVVSAVGCLLAQALLVAVGFLVYRDFWHEYLQLLRVAMPLAVVFGLGAMVHGSLRGRIQQIEAELHLREVTEERTRKLAAEARLRSLEARIHPHFLFNTLNSISALIAVNPGRAEQVVGRLASLLRVSLDTTDRPLIPLREELAMVESYVDIEKVRLGEKLRCCITVPSELQESQVPPMSVQSLVENAVKYAIVPQSTGVSVMVAATTESDTLRIEVQDTGPGFDLAVIPAGHGLDSLVGRLDALFGAKARLNVLRRGGYSVVEMVLPRV